MIASPNSLDRRSLIADATGFHSSVLVDGFQERYREAYRNELELFLDMVAGIAGPACTVEEARKSLALALLVNEAHRTGTVVVADALGRP